MLEEFNLEEPVNLDNSVKSVNNQSSQEAKRDVSDVVFRQLSDYFFENVVFINLAYSDSGGGVTSTTNFARLSRIIDTARGMLMAPGKESRLRCQFYLKNPDVLEGYILSPTILDSQLLPNPLTAMTGFRSYVGLKIHAGVVSAVVKEADKEEKLYPLDITLGMFDSTYTDTYVLELRHNVSYTDILINGTQYGSYASDMIGTTTSYETFFPFFAPVRSTDGTSVDIVAENIQFIQKKQ